MRITGGASEIDGVAHAQQLFQKFDVDGDGKITKNEMNTSGSTHSTQGPSIDDLFGAIDTDGDGGITEAENQTFLESMKSRRSGPPDAASMVQKLFKKADSDGDGKITKEELEAALPRHDSSDALDRLFSNADPDNDGTISQSEFEAELKLHFHQRSMMYSADGSTIASTGARISRTA